MSDDDLSSLGLYNGTGAEVISGSRSPRPASLSAENITVLTSEEIAAFNAHTLADVLNYVTGIQMDMIRTPGTSLNLQVQGSNFNHVLVLLDGVALNNLADNASDVWSIPVQLIERVEIVKGAASSSWGNALGGVVNIITKNPDEERPLGGTVSGSHGSRQTQDLRAEVSGTLRAFGYYLSAGRLRSDGLAQNNSADKDNLYLKLNYALPARGALTLTTFLVDDESGMFGYGPLEVDAEGRQLISTLSTQHHLSERLKLEAALVVKEYEAGLAVRTPFGDDSAHVDESRLGGGVKLSWLGETQRMVAGVDYEHVKALSIPLFQRPKANRNADRVGVYLSDTITLGRFGVTPSARYDVTGSGGNHFSPSIGVTYALTDNTVLRGYSAKGYGLTSLVRDDPTEKVWTTQLGFETTEVPYLWLKGTLFRNDTWDVTVNTEVPGVTALQRQLKQGVEVEARTCPVLNLSLSAGYNFIKATVGEHGPEISESPRHTAQLGLRYQDSTAFQADLNGRYIDWRAEDGNYDSVIWDLHLRKTLDFERSSLELFFSVRNLLNDDYYVRSYYENPGRWAEAGVRCSF